MVQTTVVEIKKRGRVTIPKTIRQTENLKENDIIRITIEKVSRMVIT